MNTDNTKEVPSIYSEPEGTVVSFGFRVQRADVPKETNFETNVLSLIRQATFAETFIAKSAGRELTFKPAVVDIQANYADVKIDGVLGAFLTEDIAFEEVE